MAEQSPADQHVRHVLEEVAAGRMLVEEAAAKLDNGRSSGLQLQGVVGIAETNLYPYQSVSLMILLFATMTVAVSGFFRLEDAEV